MNSFWQKMALPSVGRCFIKYWPRKWHVIHQNKMSWCSAARLYRCTQVGWVVQAASWSSVNATLVVKLCHKLIRPWDWEEPGGGSFIFIDFEADLSMFHWINVQCSCVRRRIFGVSNCQFLTWRKTTKPNPTPNKSTKITTILTDAF